MTSSGQRKRLCFVATSPLTVQVFLRPHLAALSAKYDVTVVTNLVGYPVARFGLSTVDFSHIGFVRTLSPLSDILVIARLYRIFYRGSFDAVVTVTPKAGLTATLASFLARVPTRIHWFTGQVWATQKFPMRTLLKLGDRVIARATTAGLVDGLSQLSFLIDQGVGDKEKLAVLLNGSISGVDGQRFRPDEKKRAQVRAQLGIPEKSPVFLFLGRLTRDKGVLDLAASFASMEGASRPQIIFVGPDEGRLSQAITAIIEPSGKNVIFVAMTDSPEDYLAASDVLCLPSYREGFGSVVLEAGASALPVIISDVYGLRDSILSGNTGLSFPVGNQEKLTEAMNTLARSASLRTKLGQEARTFVLARFSQADIVKELGFYLANQLSGKIRKQ